MALPQLAQRPLRTSFLATPAPGWSSLWAQRPCSPRFGASA